MARPDNGRKRTWCFRLNDGTILEVSAPKGATEKQVRRRGRWSLIMGTLLASVGFAAVALASDVDVAVVDTTAPTGSVTLAPAGSGNININLSVTGNQVGTATFEVYRDWTLSGGVFTGSSHQEFTVPPRAGGDPATTFSTTGTITVGAGQADGTFTLSVGAFDITNSNSTGAKLAVGDSSNYQVTVQSPPPPSDTTPPDISYVLDPASPDGNNGWYTSDVTLTWTVTENQSPGSLVKTGCVDQNITVDQASTDYSCSATSDGGSAGPVIVSIKRDASAPSVSLVDGPADGASYYFGFVPLAPTCTASDNGPSGLASACSVSGYSTAVGQHAVEASATDNAGNSASDSHTYTVLAWTLSGFYQPVDMSGVWNTVKSGSTVPLKFEVFAGSTELTDTSIVNQPLKATQTPCEGGTTDDVELVSSGSTILRYDSTAGQFIYNWQTPKKQGYCYVVTVTTADGSSLSANFKLK